MSKSPSLRRIQADIRELSLDPSDQYYAAPLESDMHEWHFTIRGAPDTDFAGGIYHGRILLPPEYPFKPPHIVFLTPSGRFETHTKICLSFSAFHPELWQPAWGIRLILEALIAFLPSPADGAIGALDWSATERKRLAAKSKDFCCPLCGKVASLLPALKETKAAKKPSRFQKEIEELTRMQTKAHKKPDDAEDKEKKEEESKPSPADAPAATSKKDLADVAPAEATSPPTTTSTATTVMGMAGNEGAATPAVASPTPVAAETNAAAPERSLQPVVAAPPRVDPAAAAAAALPRVVVEEDDDNFKPSWLVEPALQLAIVVLSVICFLLIRKIQALCAELRALED